LTGCKRMPKAAVETAEIGAAGFMEGPNLTVNCAGIAPAPARARRAP